MFMVASYTGASLFLLYGGYAIFTSYDAPPDIAAWVPPAFMLCGGVMGIMAGYFLLGPASLIKSITAIPKSVVLTLGTTAKGGTVPELQLEVELRKMFPVPLFPARKIYIKPEEMVLPTPLSPPINSAERLTPAERKARRLEEEALEQKQLEYERSHLLTLPFRHASRAFFSLFQNTKRSFLREGFLKVKIKGYNYKLDVTGGWVLDRGRAIDRLVRVIEI